MSKKPWESKTFYVNILAIVGDLILTFTGKNPLSPELKVTILGVINLILRLVTKEAIEW